MHVIKITLFYSFILSITPLTSKATIMAQVGEKAPNFTLYDDTDTLRSLDDNDLKGKKIALYFYPWDETPGCKKQACNIRDNFASLKDHNIVIWGISPNSKQEHQSFKKKHNLPFPLLIDENKKVAKAYGAYSDWLVTSFVKRVTILIDNTNNQKIIVDIMNKVHVSTHAQDIIKQFNKIEATQKKA